MWETTWVLLLLLALAQGASAMDFGDALALVMGFSVSFVGICACLGCYARRRNLMEAI